MARREECVTVYNIKLTFKTLPHIDIWPDCVLPMSVWVDVYQGSKVVQFPVYPRSGEHL